MENGKTNRELQIGFEQLMSDLHIEISKEINFFMFGKGKTPTYLVVSPNTFELLKIYASQIVDPRNSIPTFMGLKILLDAEFVLCEFRVM